MKRTTAYMDPRAMNKSVLLSLREKYGAEVWASSLQKSGRAEVSFLSHKDELCGKEGEDEADAAVWASSLQSPS
jgi:hypothetical protein